MSDDVSYDALLLLSFGGPEGLDEVIPFLENVTRGRNIPRERLTQVGAHYQRFGGVSPINGQNRALLAAIRAELAAHDIDLPVYWGNRNWHPLLPDTLRRMRDDGRRRALVFLTSAYSSWSSCRQYLEDLARARAEVGPGAPVVERLRPYFNHPGFVEPMIRSTAEAIDRLTPEERAGAHLVFTAHSIPLAMAAASGPTGGAYERQLREVAGLVAGGGGAGLPWTLVWSSRSGPPSQPWLEPDISDHLEALHARGATAAVVVPIGFVSDHMEVVYDLDTEARGRADALGLRMERAATAGSDPQFAGMVRELVLERLDPGAERRALGSLGPAYDVCPATCCRPG